MSEIEVRIEECMIKLKELGFIAPFFFSPAIGQVIKALDEICNLIKDLSKENIRRALELIEELLETKEFLDSIAIYLGCITIKIEIDRWAYNIEYIRKWLEKKKNET